MEMHGNSLKKCEIAERFLRSAMKMEICDMIISFLWMKQRPYY